MQRCCRSNSPPADRRLPSGRRFLPPPFLRSEVLRHLHERFILVQQLIAALGPNFRVAYTPADHPEVTIAVALRDIDVQVRILGNFRLVDVPPPSHPLMDPPHVMTAPVAVTTLVVLWIMPLLGSQAPIGYIYDPTPARYYVYHEEY